MKLYFVQYRDKHTDKCPLLVTCNKEKAKTELQKYRDNWESNEILPKPELSLDEMEIDSDSDVFYNYDWFVYD